MGQSCSRDHYICEEFLLISIPQQRLNPTLEILSKAGGTSSASIFPLPDLKVGTLDSLFSVSDDLVRLERSAEGTLKSMLGYENNFEKLHLRNTLEMKNSVMYFHWDHAKYPNKQAIKEIADIIEKQLLRAELDIKKQGMVYQEVKTNLKQLEVKASDSLVAKDWDEILNPEDFKLDSDHFKVVPVLVPKLSKKDFLAMYTTFASMVVPESAVLLDEDKQHCLYKVTMFKTNVDEFKTKAVEHKFIVREFDPSTKNAKQEIREQLQSEEAKLQRQFIRWLSINFREVFGAYLHVKALRVFVESVLRYGLPLSFKSIFIEPRKGAERKVMTLLNRLFADLDTDDGPIEHNGDVGIMTMIKTHNLDEYYKYVFMKIQTNFRN
uniref:V-type proton ATPase subunit C n=1 Tax=Acrobeloides nanus TaxID=290746 RepID=A0A914CMR8_9BILA